jgi:hypothetical protein
VSRSKVTRHCHRCENLRRHAGMRMITDRAEENLVSFGGTEGKGNAISEQAVKAHRLVRRRGSHIF